MVERSHTRDFRLEAAMELICTFARTGWQTQSVQARENGRVRDHVVCFARLFIPEVPDVVYKHVAHADNSRGAFVSAARRLRHHCVRVVRTQVPAGGAQTLDAQETPKGLCQVF